MKRFAAILLFLPPISIADEALVAVATNFKPALEVLRNDFEETSAHRIKLSAGSTGVLFAQITNGAPYDLFFAADQARPQQLEQKGLGVPGSRFTYAEGRLAFWARKPDLVRETFKASIQNSALRILAIANPQLAPYGKAAEAAIHTAAPAQEFNVRLVYGENAGQAFSLAATGNADAGVVALASVLLKPAWLDGAYIEVPVGRYPRILQDAVLLQHGAENTAAIEFFEFLQSDDARAKIASFGYRE